MSYVNFNRAYTGSQIESLQNASDGKIYFAKDGGIYMGNSDGTAKLKSDITPIVSYLGEESSCAYLVPSAKTVYDTISEVELITAFALNDLNSRIEELPNTYATHDWVEEKRYASIVDTSYISYLDATENSYNFAREKNKIFAPIATNEEEFNHICNEAQSTSQNLQDFKIEINTDFESQLITSIFGEGQAIKNSFVSKPTWWKLNNGVLMSFDNAVAANLTSIEITISNFVSIRNDTGLIASDYEPVTVGLSQQDSETIEEITCRGYSNGEDPSNIEFVTLHLDIDHSLPNTIEFSAAGNNDRFSIYEIAFIFGGGETSYIWDQLGKQSDINILNRQVSVNTANITDLMPRTASLETRMTPVEEVCATVGNVQINTISRLPHPSPEYANKMYTYAGDLYMCKNTGVGFSKYYSFENLGGSSSGTQITDSNWSNFSRNITNGFSNDFELDYVEDKVFAYPTYFRFGSSKGTGDIRLHSLIEYPISDVAIDIQNYSSSKPAHVIIETENNVIDTDINAGATQTFTLTDCDSDYIYIDNSVPDTAHDLRINLINGMTVSFGTPNWEWVKIGESGASKEVLEIIEEIEEVTATAIAYLDDNINTVSQTVDENERVTAEALAYLKSYIDTNAQDIAYIDKVASRAITYLYNELYPIKSDFIEFESVSAYAIAYLNDNVDELANVVQEIENVSAYAFIDLRNKIDNIDISSQLTEIEARVDENTEAIGELSSDVTARIAYLETTLPSIIDRETTTIKANISYIEEDIAIMDEVVSYALIDLDKRITYTSYDITELSYALEEAESVTSIALTNLDSKITYTSESITTLSYNLEESEYVTAMALNNHEDRIAYLESVIAQLQSIIAEITINN